MYEEDAETKARSKPDWGIAPTVVPASKQYEYLLVIDLPPHVSNEMMLLKKTFHRQFDHYPAVVTRPHITLCNFSESVMKEEEMIKGISAVTVRHAPFRLSLENFDGFPSHTIFVSILNPDFIIEIVSDLKGQLKLSSKSSRYIMNPHLTIARGLDKEKFSRASAEFCEQQYAASFVVRSILLLRREANVKFAKYEAVKEFRLEGRANNTRMFSQKQISATH
jgi:2'-5' RNA ligase